MKDLTTLVYVFDDALSESHLDDYTQAVMLRSMWHMAGRGLLTLGSVESIADRRERIQQRWDARLLQRLNQHTAPAKGSPRRSGRL